MRSLRIFGIGSAVLILAFVAMSQAKWVLLAGAALPLALLVIGQFLFPRSTRGIQIWMNPEVVERFGEVKMRLSGKEVPLSFFKTWHEFRVEVTNFWLLTSIGLLSLGAIAGVSTISEFPMPGALLYYGASAWSPVCYVAWRWIWERRAMRGSGIALGSFRVARVEKPFLKRVVYRFNDRQGGYRAGSIRSLFCETRDDLTVVFYDESDPEISVPASAMMFHKLKWAEPVLEGS